MASDCVSPTESARPDAAAERAPLFRRPRSVAAVPVVFLGLGLYRAWIEIVFVGTFVVAVALATAVLLSERDLSSRWGANFPSGGTDSAAMIRKQELADRCDEIARTYKLSAREEEVLLLLAQRKTVGIIERELLIANGTAKAHVRHIYQKLDIHTRQELFDLLGLDGRETGPQD